MDPRLALPVLLLVGAIALSGAVQQAMVPQRHQFELRPAPDTEVALALRLATDGAPAPEFEWVNPPAGATRFVLIGEDLDALPEQRVFWVADQIDPHRRRVGAGDGTYRAPALNASLRHRLRFTLLALDGTETTPAAAQLGELEHAFDSSLAATTYHAGGGWLLSR